MGAGVLVCSVLNAKSRHTFSPLTPGSESLLCSAVAEVVDLEAQIIRNQETGAMTSPTVAGSEDGVTLKAGEDALPLLSSGRAVAAVKRVMGESLSNTPGAEDDIVALGNLKALSVNGVIASIQDNLVTIDREWFAYLCMHTVSQSPPSLM